MLSGGEQDAIYINEDWASPDGWKRFDIEQQSSHSQCMEIIDVQGQRKLMLTSAGHMSQDADNYVSVAVMDVPS